MILPSFKYERDFFNSADLVLGLDEVGRGALAGPVYVGLVGLFKKTYETKKRAISLLGINDSKKKTAKQRESLYRSITALFDIYKLSYVDSTFINTYGISKAIEHCMIHSIKEVLLKVRDIKVHALVDGRDIKPIGNYVNYKSIIKGDQKSISIAAASIIAKVTRDKEMKKLHNLHPLYDWFNNMGYGTQKHIQGIKSYGKTVHHRDLYLRKILAGSA